MEKLYGLIGEKLSHTYSPFIHKKILHEINIEGHYGVFQVERNNIQHVVSGLKALGYNGVNVTIPYKTEIIDYLDSLSCEAERIGAVNVVKFDRNGKSTGFNTDYYGFGMMLDNFNVSVKHENVLVLGTGGASKAVIQYLIDNGTGEITIASRNIESAKIKYGDHKIVTYDSLSEITDCSLIINTTPVGMHPNTDSTPVSRKHLKNFLCAIDLIYNPAKTLFLKEAEEEGLKTINGLYMLVSQAIKSHEIWNDIKIPEKTINDIINYFEQENHV